jgi:RNA polymerase sigma-70 factor (ECF subfamily)
MAESPDDGGGRSAWASTDPASTLALIERAKRGDQSALDKLFSRHYAPLRRWASGRLPRWARDVADTDDIVQEVLLQTFKRIDGFEARGSGALYAYLRQGVLNRIRDQVRSHGRKPAFTALDEGQVDGALSPLEHAIGREALERYEGALARLKPEDQEAIIGRVELGCTYGELAESLGKPSSEAARKAAQRALVRLIEEMERGNG